MTATVVLQLVQEGKLALDDPLSKFVDGLPERRRDQHRAAARDAQRPLLLHVRPGVQRDAGRRPAAGVHTRRAAGDRPPQPAQFAPGTEFNYSNTNYVLLGVIIEQLTGKADRRGVRGATSSNRSGSTTPPIRRPTTRTSPVPTRRGTSSGRTSRPSTRTRVPAAELPAALDGSLAPIESTILNHSAFFTAGAVISTLPDMADYVEALVGGEAPRRAHPGDPDRQHAADELRAPRAGTGTGSSSSCPSSSATTARRPGYSSVIAYDLERDITIVVATNMSASPVDGNNAAIVLTKAGGGRALRVAGE